MDRIKEETLVTLSRIRLMKEKPKEEELPRKRARVMQFSHGDGQGKIETVRREGKKVGRNDPCPCGSGKKYKKCCGRNA
jgi:preprotein translocase subunit SecA